MAYQALYRQWRSRAFGELIGQEAITQTLRRQVMTGRVAHAYLFSGTRGTGKTSTAQILARAVNCLAPEDGEPCGRCASCVALAEGASLDVEEIDAASNNGVDEIRALRDKIRYPPQTGKYRVYIIDEVHMLSTSAFNALLKTLEEPPPHAVLILATTEPQRLPATILSRCQRFDFKRISVNDIAGRLREAALAEGASIGEEALLAVARAARGSMRDGMSLLDVCIARSPDVTLEVVESAIGTAGGDFLYGVTDALCAGDAGAALKKVDAAMREGRDAAVLARDLAEHLRCVVALRFISEEEGARVLEISPGEAARLREQGERMGVNKAMRALEIISRVEPEMRWAAHPRVLLELALARIAKPEEETDLAALLQRVETLEQKLAAGVTLAVKPAATAIAKQPEIPKAEIPTAETQAQPPADDGALWKRTLEIIRKTRFALFPTLRRARFAGVENGVAAVLFSQEDNVHADRMRKEDNLKTLADALSEAAGQAVAARVDVGSAAPSAAPPAPQAKPAEERWVQDAISLFGRDKVDIVEKGGEDT